MDLVLETKPGSMKVLFYVPKPITNQEIPKRMKELEKSLRKTKDESTIIPHDLHEGLNVTKVVVENQYSHIEALNSQ